MFDIVVTEACRTMCSVVTSEDSNGQVSHCFPVKAEDMRGHPALGFFTAELE